jgi:DNA-binding protein Fis
LKALERSDGIKNKAAQLLGIKRTTLIEKLKRHALLPSG